ncbi:MAG: hypothetical protein ACK4VK_03420 [Aquificaceae bacterium]
MDILPHYMSIYKQILQDLENALSFLKVSKPKAGRKPKLTNVNRARTQKILRLKGRGRKKRSVWFRELVENCVVYGDRGYRGCEKVEGVISQIKLFNAGSGWRTLTCVLLYVYAYAISYSFYRRSASDV